jgi:hypothetical protein
MVDNPQCPLMTQSGRDNMLLTQSGRHWLEGMPALFGKQVGVKGAAY